MVDLEKYKYPGENKVTGSFSKTARHGKVLFMSISDFFQYDYQWMAYVGAIVSSAIAIIVLVLLAQKFHVRKAKTLYDLRNMVAFLAIAPTIDYILFTINALNPGWRATFDYVELGSFMSFTMNAIANIFLLAFIRDVFFDGKKKGGLMFLAVLEAAVGPALVVIFFTGDPDLPLIALLLHVTAALAIYIVLATNAFRLRDRIKTDATKQVESHGLAYIGISGLVMFSAIILFVIHEVIILVPIREYWTVTLGWLLGAIAGVIVYLGFTPPEKMKKRWASHQPRKARTTKKADPPEKSYS